MNTDESFNVVNAMNGQVLHSLMDSKQQLKQHQQVETSNGYNSNNVGSTQYRGANYNKPFKKKNYAPQQMQSNETNYAQNNIYSNNDSNIKQYANNTLQA